MKLSAFAFVTTAASVSLLSGCRSHIRTETAILADSIAHIGAVQGQVIGMTPNVHVSKQFSRFVRLADSATTPELLELSERANPALRFYSLQALSYRDDEAVLPCLRSHLSDTVNVERLLFDMVDNRPISWFVANEFIERYFRKTLPIKLDYLQVRNLASDSSVPSALAALARFRKQKDVDFLKEHIRKSIFVLPVLPNNAGPYYPYYGLAAIRDFPDPGFYSLVIESVDSLVAGRRIPQDVLFQAIIQYRSDSAADLLRRAFNYSSQKDKYRAQVDLAVALIKFPDQFFRRQFAEMVKLDFETIAMWYQWSTDKL